MRKRILALATAGAAALLLGTGASVLHQAQPALAAQPVIGAVACANSTNGLGGTTLASDITWATSPTTGNLSSSQTPTFNVFGGVAVGPGNLSLATPTKNVICAVVMQDGDGVGFRFNV